MDTRDQALTKLTRLHDESHPTPHRPASLWRNYSLPVGSIMELAMEKGWWWWRSKIPLSEVPNGLQIGESSVFVITNPPSSPIPWCSPLGVSNSFVGSLVGEDLDEIHHVINRVCFVRAWSLVSTMFWDWCWYDFAMLNACQFGPGAMI